MKLQFEGNLAYQQAAINAVVDVFKGQDICQSTFTVVETNALEGLTTTHAGYGNKLNLLPAEVLANIREVQVRNHLPPEAVWDIQKTRHLDLTVEMETGTGKTYVYLRTILELNRRYGFTKFIIVVPSISIKEGVKKSLEITEAHFKTVFDNVVYDYFVYDSKKLSEVGAFARNKGISIMVINTQAFAGDVVDDEANGGTQALTGKPAVKSKRSNRIMLQNNDKIGGIPIKLVADTNPIVIVDEPQSSLSSDLQRQSVAALNPLAVLRYSATHRDVINQVFKLDAIDAYQMGLVKQIEVTSAQVLNVASSGPYIKLLSVSNKNGIKAKLEFDQRSRGVTKRVTKELRDGDDLLQISGLDSYDGYHISEINAEKGREYVSFRAGETRLKIGDAIGGINQDELMRVLIAETIKTHLDTQLRLLRYNIKVLSLFFIDEVAKYRQYDEAGQVVDGPYARMFVEEYSRLARSDRYQTLFNQHALPIKDAHKVHNGYFSVAKRAKAGSKEKFEAFVDSSAKGQSKADEETYTLIMKDKERLLDLKEPLSFLFSHSALKEGWDNPNVFQICTLKDAGASDIRRRQEIGRGLRLAVDQSGTRIKDKEVNVLTVFATESYQEFVDGLQTEYQNDGARFNYVSLRSFAFISKGYDELGNTITYSTQECQTLLDALKMEGYISQSGKVEDKLKKALVEKTVVLPEGYAKQRAEILQVLTKAAGDLNIKPSKQREKVVLRKEWRLSDEFKTLWDKIKYKTTYHVSLDTATLISKSIEGINALGAFNRGSIGLQYAKVAMHEGGVEAQDVTKSTKVIESKATYLPDLVSFIMNDTKLKRSTVVEILKGVQNIKSFERSPQRYIDECIRIINYEKGQLLREGIKYTRLGDNAYYAQELFSEQELYGVLTQNMVESTKSPFEHVVYDSTVERTMALEFEKNREVICYTKLPSWFKIPTPLGSYNPDWAVLMRLEDGSERLYLVVETKGSDDINMLRTPEQAKIDFGKAHFKALSGVEFRLASTYESLYNAVSVSLD